MKANSVYIFICLLVFVNLLSCNRSSSKYDKLMARVQQDSIKKVYKQNWKQFEKSIDSLQYEERKRKSRERWAAEALKDSMVYLTEPLISTDEVNELKPVLKRWLDFYELDLAQFRLTRSDSINTEYFLTDDPEDFYYREFDKQFHGSYTPQSRDYSPNRRRYINLLETTYVYKDKEDGKWYWYGSDDCQEIRLVDLDRRTTKMFCFTGTQFRDGAFWKNNDYFILTEKNYDNEYRFYIYDFKKQIHHSYRLKAPFNKNDYMVYDMKSRGVIVK